MARNAITHTNDEKAALDYTMKGSAHNNDKYIDHRRFEYATGINCTAQNALSQWRGVDKQFGILRKKRRLVQRQIQSFDPRQLDYRDPNDVWIAHQIGLKTAKKVYPAGFQVVVVTQADTRGDNNVSRGKGKGRGMKVLHNHIIAHMVNITNGHSLPNKCTDVHKVAHVSDDVIRGFHNSRGEQLNPEAHKHMINSTYGREPSSWFKSNEAEYHIKQRGKYSWTADIKTRCKLALRVSLNWKMYIHNCRKRGVKVNAFRKNGKLKKRTSYSFKDRHGKVRHIRSSRLGYAYSPQVITKTTFPLVKKYWAKVNERHHASEVASQSASIASASVSASISNSASIASSASSASAKTKQKPTFDFFRGLNNKTGGARDTYAQLTIQPNSANEAKKRKETHDFYKTDKHDRGLIDGFISSIKQTFNEVRQAFRRYCERISSWLKRHRIAKMNYGEIHTALSANKQLKGFMSNQNNQPKHKTEKPTKQVPNTSQLTAVQHQKKLDKELLTTHPKSYQQYIYSFNRFGAIVGNYASEIKDPRCKKICYKYQDKENQLDRNTPNKWYVRRQKALGAQTRKEFQSISKTNNLKQSHVFGIAPGDL